jgi:hypothetical protein
VVSDPAQEMALSIALILLLVLVHLGQAQQWTTASFWRRTAWLRWAAYLSLTLAVLNLGITEEVPFIYFQF